MTGNVIRRGMFDLQVCVPRNWTDDQVLLFAEKDSPCGTKNGWQIRRTGHKDLNGDPERTACAEDATRVHVVLDA